MNFFTTLSLTKMQAFWQYKFYTDIQEGCVPTIVSLGQWIMLACSKPKTPATARLSYCWMLALWQAHEHWTDIHMVKKVSHYLGYSNLAALSIYIRIEISYECYRWHWTDSVFFGTRTWHERQLLQTDHAFTGTVACTRNLHKFVMCKDTYWPT